MAFFTELDPSFARLETPLLAPHVTTFPRAWHATRITHLTTCLAALVVHAPVLAGARTWRTYLVAGAFALVTTNQRPLARFLTRFVKATFEALTTLASAPVPTLQNRPTILRTFRK